MCVTELCAKARHPSNLKILAISYLFYNYGPGECLLEILCLAPRFELECDFYGSQQRRITKKWLTLRIRLRTPAPGLAAVWPTWPILTPGALTCLCRRSPKKPIWDFSMPFAMLTSYRAICNYIEATAGCRFSQYVYAQLGQAIDDLWSLIRNENKQ